LRNKYEKPVQVEEVKTETNKVDTSEYNEQ